MRAILKEALSAVIAEIKDKIKTLYEQTKDEAETTGITPIQSKQTEIERKLSKFASAVAITEHEILQYLQELWKNKGFDPHHKN